jgi:hypothetical protein
MVDQSEPSERRDVAEGAEPHQESEDTTAGGRQTAPMGEFTTGDVGLGVAVFVVGLVVTFGIPLLFF